MEKKPMAAAASAIEEAAAAQRVVVVVHSQVRRIKEEEDEKVRVHETYQHLQPPEMRPVLGRDLARQRSRSPLGRVVARSAISIGVDS